MRPNPSKRFLYNLGYKVASSVLNLLCRPEVYHAERAPMKGPLLVAANHTSYLDPLLVGTAMPRELYYMAKDTLFWGPLGWLIRSLNAFPVKRGEVDLGAFRTALKVLREGNALLVFPEGTRGTGEELLQARKGVGFLAARTSAPVLPVFVEGLERVLGRGQWWIRRAQARVYFGEALTFPPEIQPEDISQQVLEAIADLRARRSEIQLDCPTRLR